MKKKASFCLKTKKLPKYELCIVRNRTINQAIYLLNEWFFTANILVRRKDEQKHCFRTQINLF